jgi:putative DNA primase/helicase
MDFQSLASELLARSETLCREWFPAGNKSSNEYKVGDLQGRAGDSLSINLNTGKWSDFATGEAGGDFISLYAAAEGISQGDAFKQLSNGHAPKCMSMPAPKKPVQSEPALTFILPCPETAEPPDFGNASAVWQYLDQNHETLGYIARYDPTTGRKSIVPFVYTQEHGWTKKQFPEPRPMYGLETVENAERVLLVEGEKACDAARMFAGKNYSVMTWSGGAKASHKTDFTVLHGKKLLLWPDADAAGVEVMNEIAERLVGHCPEIKIIDVTGLADGYDAADTGFTTFKQFADFAKPRATEFVVKPKLLAAPYPSVIDYDTGEIIEQSPKPSAPVIQIDTNGYAPEYSDSDIAIRFVGHMQGDVLWCETWGRWMVWQGNRWVKDETLIVPDLVRSTSMAIATELLGRPEQDQKARIRQANQLSSFRTIKSVEQLAKMDRRCATHPNEWDADMWLINTPDCVVDLRDGSQRPHRREDKITKSTSVSPSGSCPTWLKFLDTATAGDKELQAFLQRMCGYVLTGVVREHALFFVYGTGGNGKGTFLNTITSIMADYQQVASAETFTESKGDRHLTELARLVGSRLVSAQETEEGKRWAEARIKSLTGGDPITANFMRQDHFTFIPQFKLVIAGNHKPAFRAVDEAIRRRLHLIPFTVSIPASERDPFLSEKLKAEAGGILKWMIEGCLMWQRDGLAPPAIVKDHTDCYLGDEDTIAQWIDECCTVGPHCSAPMQALYESYKDWCERNGEFIGKKKALKSKLEGRGFSEHRTSKSRDLTGIMVGGQTFE